MDKDRINKILEAVFSFLSILGAICVSSQVMVGWVIWIVASTTGVIWGIRTKNNYVAIMNAFFTVTNSIGIYNYLITPYLSGT